MDYQSTIELARAPREKAAGKTLTYTMRVLHRDIGFLMIGLTLVFALSGILLVYRSTDFMKSETQVTRTLEADMKIEDVGRALHLRKLDVGEDDGRRVAFSSGAMASDGSYDRETGEVSYTAQQLPGVLEKLNALHKTGSGSPLHWFSVVYGALLTFLAVSSLWMFKPKTRQFRRGLVLAGVGFAAAAALVAAI
jgi:hypothetical protein